MKKAKPKKRKRALGKKLNITADFIMGDDGGYSVWCPELDVSARGADLDDAFENFEEAVRLFLEGFDQGTYLH